MNAQKKKLKNPFEKDGTTLVRKVITELERLGWKTETRQPFLDPYENTHRDIDIVASYVMTEYPSATNLLQKTLTFEIKLFIECKYIVESVGLHTRPSNKEKSEKALLSLNAYSKICQHGIDKLVQAHRYLSSPDVVYDSSDDSVKGYGLYAVKQAAHGLLSGFHKSNADYSLCYPLIIADKSDKIFILKKGSDLQENYSTPLLFEYEFIHHLSHRQGILFVEVLTLDNIYQFLVDRIAELIELTKLGKMHVFNQRVRNSSDSSIMDILQ